MDKRKFRIEIEYFKESGKYYSSDSFEREFENCCDNPDHPICYMNKVCDYVRELNKIGPMPGLSGRWLDGYIRVDCKEGFPCLIIPDHLRVYSSYSSR